MMHNPIGKCLQGARVLWNLQKSPGYYHMGLQCEGKLGGAEPGQFIMVRLPNQVTPLLRRPFSIHQLVVEQGEIKGYEILYKVVGDGTASLASCREGDAIDVLGPLGRGFSLYDECESVYFVAGGIGVAPFLFLSTRMHETGYAMSRVTVFIGGRSKDDLLCTEAFKRAGMKLRLTTDDGSRGERSLVTDSLEIGIKKCRPGMLYACGPIPMLKKVIAISDHYDLRCQVSIETMMACGMGACLGCAVEGRSTDRKYRHACVDGPVFDAQDIIL